MFNDFNLFSFFFNILNMLGRWSTLMYDFLFTPVTSPLLEPLLKLLGITEFIPFYALGGAVIVVLLVLYLVKTFVPML